MFIFVTDSQVVGESNDQLFELIQVSAPVQVFLRNSGSNVISYDFQQSSDGGNTWTDIDVLGTDFNNTISNGQVKNLTLSSTNPQVRLMGSASGGSILDFSISRQVNRSSGGAIPILSI